MYHTGAFFLLSLINYFVFAFRGHEMLAADIYNVRTALSVASSYCFPVVRPLLCLGAPYLLFILPALILSRTEHLKQIRNG